MDQITVWIVQNWGYLLVGFMVLEKAVKISPWKWDDLVVDGCKEVCMVLVKLRKK